MPFLQCGDNVWSYSFGVLGCTYETNIQTRAGIAPGAPTAEDSRRACRDNHQVVNREVRPVAEGMTPEARARKECPMYSGLLVYFPDALEEVARLSFKANEQHNPGQPVHWAREKSTDHDDASLRHKTDRAKGIIFDTDGMRHRAKAAWRELAALQLELEADNHTP